jgi:AbrB family looped-hinge helix DNA binding protein
MKEQTRSSISTRGRVTIPVDLRKRLGLKAGTRVNWMKQDGRLILTTAATVSKKAKPAKDRRGEALATDH